MINQTGEFVVSTIVSALCSLGLVKWLANSTRDRWMAAVAAKYDGKLEHLKDELSRGAYISKAQWDLELSAYRELWDKVGQLRNDCRSLLSSQKFPIVDERREAEYLKKAFSEAIGAFHDAHNAAVLATDRYGPFYPASIKRAAQEVTAADMDVIGFYASQTDWFSDRWFSRLEALVHTVTERVESAENAIRDRLTSVRVQF